MVVVSSNLGALGKQNLRSGMNDQEFANKVFKEAKNNGYQITSHGNIKCPHNKNLSEDKIRRIHNKLGSNCPNATSEQLKDVGIQPCCFEIFRKLAQLLYP